MFVRRDLYEGKYSPDTEKQKEFERETLGNLDWSDDLADKETESENIKIEL